MNNNLRRCAVIILAFVMLAMCSCSREGDSEIVIEHENAAISAQHSGISQVTFVPDGYTASALFRIMQADVPVIIIGEKITSEGLDLLKEIRKYICVISINDAWKTLLDIDIVPDFIFSESFVLYKTFESTLGINVLNVFSADSETKITLLKF